MLCLFWGTNKLKVKHNFISINYYVSYSSSPKTNTITIDSFNIIAWIKIRFRVFCCVTPLGVIIFGAKALWKFFKASRSLFKWPSQQPAHSRCQIIKSSLTGRKWLFVPEVTQQLWAALGGSPHNDCLFTFILRTDWIIWNGNNGRGTVLVTDRGERSGTLAVRWFVNIRSLMKMSGFFWRLHFDDVND